MNKCRYKAQNRIPLVLIVISYFLFAVFFLVLGIVCTFWGFEYYDNLAITFYGMVGFAILFFCLSGLILVYAHKLYSMETRLYDIADSGLYLDGTFHPWNEIHEISIYACSTNATITYERHEVLICVFLKPKPRDFGRKILSFYDFYCPLNQKKFAIIDYSDAICTELLDKYPGTIYDCRLEQSILLFKDDIVHINLKTGDG